MLSEKDWKKVHDLALQIHTETNEQRLAELAVEGLPQLIDCEYACWNEHHESTQLTRLLTSPTHAEALDQRVEAINQTMGSHPVLTALEMTEKMNLFDGTHDMTDYLATRQIRETAIYREVYRKVDAEHQVITQFFFSEGRGVVLGLNNRRPFSERQRFTLERIKEHFAVACGRFLSFRQMSDLLENVCQPHHLETLTKREREALRYVTQGKTNAEIGVILGISKRTAEKHVSSVLEKLGFESRQALFAATTRLEP